MRQTNRCFFPSLERELNDWNIQARANGIIVTGTRILIQAKLIAEKNGVELFRGSKGWLSNFLARHDYSLRRINSMGIDAQESSSDEIQLVYEKSTEPKHQISQNIRNVRVLFNTNIIRDSNEKFL